MKCEKRQSGIDFDLMMKNEKCENGVDDDKDMQDIYNDE